MRTVNPIESDLAYKAEHLLSALEDRAATVKTHVVVVSHQESWSIDRNVVDVIGTFFDIDPIFFRSHFDYPLCHYEKRYPEVLIDERERDKCFIRSRQTLIPISDAASLPSEGFGQRLRIGLEQDCVSALLLGSNEESASTDHLNKF